MQYQQEYSVKAGCMLVDLTITRDGNTIKAVAKAMPSRVYMRKIPADAPKNSSYEKILATNVARYMCDPEWPEELDPAA